MSSSQRPFGLARDARPRVCTPACNTIYAFQHVAVVYPPAMVARYLYRCIHAPQTVYWVIQGPSTVSAWLVPRLYYQVCLVIGILHLVRPSRHLSLASHPPNAALCGAFGCRPHWQCRQSSCRAAVGNPPNELRPALAVRPPQSLQSRTCPRPRHSTPRQCSAHTLDGRPIPRSRTCHVSPWCRHTPHIAFACSVAEKAHRARPRPPPSPLSSLRLLSSLPLPAQWSPSERVFELVGPFPSK